MYIIPDFSWLPWYLNLLMTFPMVLFIVLAVWRIVIAIVEIVVKIRGLLPF